VDSRGEEKIMGIYINPSEFPNAGLLVVTNKSKIMKFI
jgi:hypothetical protein